MTNATEERAQFTRKDVGCYADGCRGLYTGVTVIDFATVDYGFKTPKWYDELTPDRVICEEDFFDLVTEVTEYLNTLCADGVHFEWDAGDLLLVLDDEGE